MHVVRLANEMDRSEVGVLEQQQHWITVVCQTLESVVQEFDNGCFSYAAPWREGAARTSFARLLAHEGFLQDHRRSEMFIEERLDLAILGVGRRFGGELVVDRVDDDDRHPELEQQIEPAGDPEA